MKKIISIFCLLALLMFTDFSAYCQSPTKPTNSTQGTMANEWYASPCTGTNYWNFGTITPTTSSQNVGGNNYGPPGSELLGMGSFTVTAVDQHFCFQLKITGSGYPYGGGGEIMILDKACGTASQTILADFYGAGTSAPNQTLLCGCYTSVAADVGQTRYIQLSEGSLGGSYFGADGFCTVWLYYQTGDYTCNAGNNIVLPIELTKFTATPINEKIKVEWATASETNNNYFTVEKSLNGIDFAPVTKVKGAGKSTSILNYCVYDEEPAPGLNYYRIKQVDFNGEYKYSQIIFSSINPIVSRFNPNPATEYVNFRFRSPANTTAAIQITDITGRVVYERPQEVVAGDQLINVPLYSMESGVYYFKVSIDEIGYSYTTKLIKN